MTVEGAERATGCALLPVADRRAFERERGLAVQVVKRWFTQH